MREKKTKEGRKEKGTKEKKEGDKTNKQTKIKRQTNRHTDR